MLYVYHKYVWSFEQFLEHTIWCILRIWLFGFTETLQQNSTEILNLWKVEESRSNRCAQCHLLTTPQFQRMLGRPSPQDKIDALPNSWWAIYAMHFPNRIIHERMEIQSRKIMVVLSTTNTYEFWAVSWAYYLVHFCEFGYSGLTETLQHNSTEILNLWKVEESRSNRCAQCHLLTMTSVWKDVGETNLHRRRLIPWS